MDIRQLTRRRLLKYAGLGAAGLAFARPGFEPGTPAADFGPQLYDDGSDRIPGGVKGDPGRVIIVGAGFAGLAAAKALSNAGVPCVLLEGRARPGGRADTRQVGGTAVDLGASWIHEPEGNPMTRLATQAGIGLIAASPEADALTVLLHDDRLGDVADADKLAAYINALKFDEERKGIGRELGREASYRDGAERFLDEQGLRGDERRWAGFVIQLYAELEGAESWSRQPLNDRPGRIARPKPNHPEYTGDGLGSFPQGGYHRIVRALAAGLDIRYRHRVTEVGVGRSGAMVKFETGSPGRRRQREIRGSHVLITVPLGVLKSGSIRFRPGLPAMKRRAVRNLGFGNLEKVALTFDQPFWQEDGRTHLLHVGRENSADFPMFIDLQRFTGKPTLVALNAGPVARRLSRQGPAATRREAMEILRGVYGRSIPSPEAVAVTNWLNDPFARGSYSAVVMGTRGDDRSHLAAPVAGRILFAGEATNLDGRPSTTDGAFSSGIREAKRLLNARSVQVKV